MVLREGYQPFSQQDMEEHEDQDLQLNSAPGLEDTMDDKEEMLNFMAVREVNQPPGQGKSQSNYPVGNILR